MHIIIKKYFREVIVSNVNISYLSHHIIQLSADIKMKDYKIKTSLVRTNQSKARAHKTGFNFMIFILLYAEFFFNTMLYWIF